MVKILSNLLLVGLREFFLPASSLLPDEDRDASSSLRQDPVPPDCQKYFSRLDLLVTAFPEHDFPNGRSLYSLSVDQIKEIPAPIMARLRRNAGNFSHVKVIACSRKDIEMSVGFEVDNRVRVLFDIHQTAFVPQIIEDELFDDRWGLLTYRAPIEWESFLEALSFAESLGRPGSPLVDGLPGPKV